MGVSGFVPLSGDSNNLTATTYDWDIPVHRINWPKAQFMLEACDDFRCLPSASISAMDVMANAIGYFKASNTGTNDEFGYSVALSGNGNTLAVGTFREGSKATGIGGDQSDDCAVKLPASCAASSGAVYVYTRSGNTWKQQAYVKASNTGANDMFGYSIALSMDGNTLAVGALLEASSSTGIGSTPDELAPYAGAVYVYTRSGIIWTPQAYVKASNTEAGDLFGYSVALSADGNTLVVGAALEDSAAIGIGGNQTDDCTTILMNCAKDSGAVYTYIRSGVTWTPQAYVKASNTGAGDAFGSSVALSTDGNTLAVNASSEDSAATGVNNTTPGQSDNSADSAGAVYLY